MASTQGVAKVGVIGAGVAAAFCVRQILAKARPGSVIIHVFDLGRVPGGRASRRTSRSLPGLKISHGLPAFTVTSDAFASALEGEEDIRVWSEVKLGLQMPNGDRCGAPGAPPLFTGMHSLCRRYINEKNGVHFHGSTPVTNISYSNTAANGDGPWKLCHLSPEVIEGQRETCTSFMDALVMTSHSAAHERWRKVFGNPPPFDGCRGSQYGALSDTLKEIAGIESNPVYTLILAVDKSDPTLADAMSGFDMIHVENNSTIRKLVAGGCSSWDFLTIHSSTEWASAAAKENNLGEIKLALWDALKDLVRPYAELDSIEDMKYSAIHRWGAAFSTSLYCGETYLEDERLAVCGDFVSTGSTPEVRPGTVEAAAMSGLKSGADIVRSLGLDKS